MKDRREEDTVLHFCHALGLKWECTTLLIEKEIYLFIFHLLTSMDWGTWCENSSQKGQNYLGCLLTMYTLWPKSPHGNEEGKTDESSKEGMTPLIPSCLLHHLPRGKFNKVHIPRATKERDENTWKDRWRGGDGEVAVMTDPSPTVSSLTFRIARDHWTPAGRMKQKDATHTNIDTKLNNTDTEVSFCTDSVTKAHCTERLCISAVMEPPNCSFFF